MYTLWPGLRGLVPVPVSVMVLDCLVLLAPLSHFNPSFIVLPYSSLEVGIAGLEHSLPIVPDYYLFFHYASTFLKDFCTWISPQPVSLHTFLAIIYVDPKVQVSNLLNSVSLYFTNFLFYSDIQTT